MEEPNLFFLYGGGWLVTVGEIECYSVTQKQRVMFENSLNFNNILISSFCVIETICYEFGILKLAVSQASFFQIWNVYCNISFEKDQICGQAYALVWSMMLPCSHIALSIKWLFVKKQIWIFKHPAYSSGVALHYFPPPVFLPCLKISCKRSHFD